MKKVFAVTAALALLGLCIAAQAAITIDTVAVGNKGNTADTTGYGSVGYNYNIGKYEVTAGQYTAFLNTVANVSDTYGLYNSNMWNDTSYGCKIQQTSISGGYSYSVASDYANRPVNYVSFWDSCRFANWLGNGQGNNDTETGAYTLTPTGIANNTITRTPGWTGWAVTSEDEWYKAAYYDPNKGGAGYWLYPTKSDSITTGMANYGMSVGHTTDVGSYGNSSHYGTFDQGGNVHERNDAIIAGAYRGLRGGSFLDDYGNNLQSSTRYNFNPLIEHCLFGFRVSEVPEPSSIIALLGGLAGLIGLRRRYV